MTVRMFPETNGISEAMCGGVWETEWLQKQSNGRLLTCTSVGWGGALTNKQPHLSCVSTRTHACTHACTHARARMCTCKSGRSTLGTNLQQLPLFTSLLSLVWFGLLQYIESGYYWPTGSTVSSLSPAEVMKGRCHTLVFWDPNLGA